MKRHIIISVLICLSILHSANVQGDNLTISPKNNPAVDAIHHAINDFVNEAYKQWTFEKDTAGIMWHRWETRLAHQAKWKADKPTPANKTLRRLWKAFDKQHSMAISAYYRLPDKHDKTVKEIRIPVGSHGEHVPVFVENQMTTRMLAFRTGEEYTTYFVLQWWEEPEGGSSGFVTVHASIAHFCEWHGEGEAPEEQRHNPALQRFPLTELQGLGFSSIKQALNSQIRGTDPTIGNAPQPGMPREMSCTLASVQEEERLQNMPHLHFSALQKKLRCIAASSQHITPTETAALVLTVKREAENYPALLSPWQFEALEELILQVKAVTDKTNHAASPTLMQACDILAGKLNHTPGLDKYSAGAQDYLNNHGWHVTTHGSGRDSLALHGEHYLSPRLWYLHITNGPDAVFHSEHVTDTLVPGIYRLRASVRAQTTNHSGVYIYALADDGQSQKKYLKEIPGNDRRAGDIWEEANRRTEQARNDGREPIQLDLRVNQMNQGQGWGWNTLVIENIAVHKGRLTYGMSNIPGFTGHQMQSQWCSACDFVLERTGDIPQ